MATEHEWKSFRTARRQAAIGTRLRRIYEDVVHEPVPSEWLDMLRQIDASRSMRQPKGA
jgi:hypothetical protein